MSVSVSVVSMLTLTGVETSNTPSSWSVGAIEFVHITKWKQDRIVFRSTHHCQFPNSQLCFLNDKKDYLKLNKNTQKYPDTNSQGVVEWRFLHLKKAEQDKNINFQTTSSMPLLQKRYYDNQTSHIEMQKLSKEHPHI